MSVNISPEIQPAREKESSRILHKVEKYVETFELGSPEIKAFSDLSRDRYLQAQSREYHIMRDNTSKVSPGEYKRDDYQIYLDNSIRIISDRIEDRKVSIKGYDKNHKLVLEYLTQICGHLYEDNCEKGGSVDYVGKVSEDFLDILERRLIERRFSRD